MAVVALMFLTYLWIGVIPLHEGAGWDGNDYVAYVKLLATGVPITNDPYRLVRMSGFVQLMPFAWRGEGKETLVFIQRLFNIGIMAVGTGCLFSCLRKLGVTPHKAILSVILFTFSWASLVIPVFYPILSDNLAIPFSCIALWCWVNQKKFALHIICAWFVWLFPALFVVPLGLIAFPYGTINNTTINIKQVKRIQKSLFALFLVIGLLAYHHFMKDITTLKISTHIISGGQTALVGFIPLSLLVQCIIIALLAWIAASIACSPQLYRGLKLQSLVLGVCTVAISFLVMRSVIDFSTGFQGPPLTANLMMQSAGAPLKPWISHFLYFGFCVLIVAMYCIRWSFNGDRTVPIGLLVIFMLFSPLLSFGSESRQWIGIFPVAIVIYALMEIKWRQQVFLAIVAVLSLFTLYGLRDASQAAVEQTLGLQSSEWQYYFGRQGPWMSVESYESGVVALIMVAITYLYLGVTGNKKMAVPDT
ncbi:hypothetical protein HXW90_23185 [Pseudomonas sp. Y39-6]|uniref:hypothetical protein n=1 Tax=Pseudomonas sp. Y39-6 TaxID=2749807 RepID=UPI001910F4B8|nr:hypothetical protein [Pseudomonas sp. Y39-6]QPO22246.1 hypothetical protein HXW90_23185 [Pseudomonas sp. Y39-6]URS59568.1 hypothetical protein JN756_23705 [Pseudomonas sp. Y39-6]